MRFAPSILAPSLAFLLLASCSDERGAGNTTQTENTVAARTIRVDSLLPSWNRPSQSTTVATLRLNQNNFEFAETDSTGRDLAVETEAGKALPFEIVYWDKPAKLGRLRVLLDSSLQHRGDRFLLRWKQPLLQRSDANSVWKTIPDSQRLALRSVLVADFEKWSSSTLLPSRPDWEVHATDSFSLASLSFVAAGKGRSGSALSVEYKSGSSGYLVVKTPLVAPRQARSIRALDSVVFYARGSNKNTSIFLAFDHHELFKAWKLDSLDTVWTRFRVRPQDFISASNPHGGNKGWEAVRDSATDLTFLVYSGTRVWFDDIRLYGIDREDLE